MSDHRVCRSTVIDAPREEVWDALVDPSRLGEWLADEVEVDELGAAVFRWEDGRERRGVIEEVEAPERLALRWAGPDGRESSVGLRAPAAGWGGRLALLACAACAVAA
jgi:uncharacterized protein YndB with AHSA1/START domain